MISTLTNYFSNQNISDLYQSSKYTNPMIDNKISIAAWNASGVSGKMEELLETMIIENISICFVSETWLPDNQIIHPTMIYSVSSKINHRVVTHQHYGLAVVVHPYFVTSTSRQNILEINTFDDSNEIGSPCFIEMTILEKIKIIGLYLSPQLSNRVRVRVRGKKKPRGSTREIYTSIYRLESSKLLVILLW